MGIHLRCLESYPNFVQTRAIKAFLFMVHLNNHVLEMLAGYIKHIFMCAQRGF